ncbi:tRNASer (uridine44-2'-O)-methyltransferase, partial [Tremellales sp. Uapishka_1]
MPLPSPLTPGGYPTPAFHPTRLPPSTTSPLSIPSEAWLDILSSPCYFPLSIFFSTLKALSLHPERNSSLILRADPLPPKGTGQDRIMDLELTEEIRVRLMPKQVKRDAKLDQRTLSFEGKGVQVGVVILIPEVGSADQIPFYHPPVKKLAYRWEAVEEVGHEQREDEEVLGKITISYLPFPETAESQLHVQPIPLRKRSPLAGPSSDDTPTSTASLGGQVRPAAVVEESRANVEQRTYRTCLALLERLNKHGYGQMVGYVKKRNHDVIVPRDNYQDLYLTLKERHRHLDSRAAKPGSSKVEDVKRHVYKIASPDDPALPISDLSEWGSQDIAIAAFLMLLWKDMYPERTVVGESQHEWDSWGRPERGFIDLGCGNGLLVHILVSEGYEGKGYELRQRRTWPLYPPRTRAALVELPINPLSWFPSTISEWDADSWPGQETCVITEGTFLIGNHSDELTPWLPLLSLIPASPVPHLSLPCCLHTLDSTFDMIHFGPPAHDHSPEGGFEHGLDAGESRYKAYLMWLGYCGLRCGWKWEKEGLRIPSTRGWGIVARNRWTTKDQDGECRAWALDQVNTVRARGAFRVRVKEGKEH